MPEEVKSQMRKTKATVDLKPVDLLPEISHAGKKLNMALFPDRPNRPAYYDANERAMKRQHFHSEQFPIICFEPATSSQSISALAHVFGDIIEPILTQEPDSTCIQIGLAVPTSKGVFINPPVHPKYPPIKAEEEKTLMKFLRGVKPVHGVYLLQNDFGFAPYKTFNQEGRMSTDEFVKSGLARVLEHTFGGEAKKLRKILSSHSYDVYIDLSSKCNDSPGRLRVMGFCFKRYCSAKPWASTEYTLYVSNYPTSVHPLDEDKSEGKGFAFGLVKPVE